MFKIFAFIGSLLMLSACQLKNSSEPKNLEYPDYQIQLKVDPQTQEIFVEGKLLLPPNIADPKELFFYLHKDLQIKTFSLNKEDCFEKDTLESDIRFIPKAVKVFLKPKQDLPKDKNIEISFSYQGKLGDLSEYAANVINFDWVEIGLYYPWFPYNPTMRPFTYQLNVEIDPEYQIFGLGEIKNTGEKWQISQKTPTNDLVLCASKDVEKFETKINENHLSIFHHHFPDSLLNKMSADITNMLETYGNWFGENHQDISIIESKREKGGGYARIGGVFLGGFKADKYFSNNEGYQRYFAHELAHLWWYKAPTNSWEDWLNESFAEYSALMVIRDVYGQEAFNQRVNDKKSEAAGVEPTWEFDRIKSKNAGKILYSKGPVLLLELETEIGKENFIKLCKLMADQKIKNTADFLSLLEQVHGTEISRNFKLKLKS